MRHELVIHGIPVDILLIPIRRVPLTNHSRQSVNITFRDNNQQTIAKLHYRVGSRNDYLPVTPQTGNHESLRRHSRYIFNCLALHAGIAHVQPHNNRLLMLIIIRFLEKDIRGKKFTHENHCKNHPDYPQRISHRTSQRYIGRSHRRISHLLQRLLRRTQRRGICHRTAENTYHVRQRYPRRPMKTQSQHYPESHHDHRQYIQLQTALSQ